MTLIAYSVIVPILVLAAVVWPSLSTRRHLPLLLLALMLAIAATHQWMYSTITGDAFITFRYAHNLASGYGPVYNPGEHVEGYSNFLQMLTLAGLNAGLALDIPVVARALGVACGLATVVLTYLLALRLTDRHQPSSLLAALLVAASGSVAAFAPSGMETPIFSLFVIGAIWTTIGGYAALSGLLIALAAMTRPEGILLFFPVILWNLHRRRMARVVATMGVAALLLVPWHVWRLSYYGHLIPNQIQAKRGMALDYQLELGIKYLIEFVQLHLPMVLLALIPASLLLGGGWRRTTRRLSDVDLMLLLTLAIYSLFIVGVGGDWMPASRFFAPFVPLGAVLTVRLWHEFVSMPPLSTGARSGFILFSFCGLLLLVNSTMTQIPVVRGGNYAVNGLSRVGMWLKESLPADTRVATLAAGALPYYSGLPTIDMLGLTDEHIALHGRRRRHDGWPGHIAYDYAYVAGQKPTLVAFLSGQGFEKEPSYRVAPEFAEDYEAVCFHHTRSGNPLGDYVNLLVLKTDADRVVPRLDRPLQGFELVERETQRQEAR